VLTSYLYWSAPWNNENTWCPLYRVPALSRIKRASAGTSRDSYCAKIHDVTSIVALKISSKFTARGNYCETQCSSYQAQVSQNSRKYFQNQFRPVIEIKEAVHLILLSKTIIWSYYFEKHASLFWYWFHYRFYLAICYTHNFCTTIWMWRKLIQQSLCLLGKFSPFTCFVAIHSAHS
jgi:hypothetical protein